MSRPLYFLTHEGNPGIFSGYGIPLKEGEKSPLVGMLMVDRPDRCSEAYLQGLRDSFGEVMLGPIISNGDGGLFAQVRIEDTLSRWVSSGIGSGERGQSRN